ncbi:protocadherin gamma-B4-like [Mercenaria mercenaria]|uniref:protocadherin gamma-B4-like n=1 Tax=Mercenaria mercenaria TaxID=6596 RepID=UPI00234F186F|nr:protocadherin gamma-B4-like [Mercenaria mercenaria]
MRLISRNLVTFLAFLALIYTAVAAPSFTTPTGGDGSANVDENSAAGAAVVTVVATPSSTKTLGAYTLVTTGSPFTLATSGELTVTAANTLDYETTPTYTLLIKVTDDTPSSTTATLTVAINDVNDAPVFSPATYTECATDGAIAGTTVTTVTGTDQDSANTLTYSITGGNTNTDFANSGAVITVAKTLAMATTSTYNLQVEVSDGTVAATSTVTITVASTCDSATALVVSFLTILTALVVSLN